jgi:hypothetical protein
MIVGLNVQSPIRRWNKRTYCDSNPMILLS